MARRTTVYSAKNNSLVIAGLVIDSGFGEGEFVSVEANADDTSDKAGADGEVAVSINNDGRATAKVKLLQGSKGNTALSQLRLTGLASELGIAIGTFLLKDRGGLMKVEGDHCWIMKPPVIARGREGVEYEWTIRIADAKIDASGAESVVVT